MNSSRFDLELQNLPHNAYNDGDILSMLELLENDKFFTKKKKLLEDMASHVSKQSFAKDLKSSLHLMLQRARIINLDELSLTRAVFYIVMQCLGAICGAGVVKGFMVCFKQISATASKTDAMHDLPSTSHVNDANEVPSSGSSKEKAESYEQLSNSIVEVGAEVDHTRDLVVVPTWSNLVTPKVMGLAASHLAAENIMEDENLCHIEL